MAILTLSAAMAEIKSSTFKYYTYCLCRPNGVPFYVGLGVGDRVQVHQRKSAALARGRKYSIIRKILRDGGMIGYDLSFFATRGAAIENERRLIALYGRLDNGSGALTNLTDGGEGAEGVIKTVSLESRAKISRIVRDAWANPEYRTRVMASMKAAKNTPEQRAIVSALKSGFRHTAEAKKKISEGNRKSVRTPEQRSKYSEALKLKWADPKYREMKMLGAKRGAEKNRGRASTPEQRAKISASLKGRTKNAEHLARIAETKRSKSAS